MKSLSLVSPLLLAFAIGCGSSQPTAQLVDARRAYEEVRTSKANQLTPAKVLEAKQALDRAERAHNDDPGSFEEKSLAYVAERQAQLAAAYADIAQADRDRQTADERYKEKQDELRRQAEARAEGAESSLTNARGELANKGQELSSERAAREAAEKRAAAAIASLQEVARVKEESRGTVITLDGSVLFVTGKSELLPLAQNKLDGVAKVLQEQGDDKTVTIEGHTDNVGSDENNNRLSQARADSVRTYLVSRGVKADRVRAVGRGESTPLAGNDTPEGRANNRRVEIIIQDQRQAAVSGSGTSSSGSGNAPSSGSTPGSGTSTNTGTGNPR